MNYSRDTECILFGCNRKRYHHEDKNRSWNEKQGRKNVKNKFKSPALRDKMTERPLPPSKIDSKINGGRIDEVSEVRAVIEKILDDVVKTSESGVNEDDDDGKDDAHADEGPGEANNDEGEVESTTCKFAFRCFWDSSRDRWFLPEKQSGCAMHTGHSHFEPKFLRLKESNLTEEERKLADDCFATKASVTTATNLLSHRSKVGLEDWQLRYRKNKKKNSLVLRDADAAGSTLSDTAEISAADRLLALLKADPDVSYLALTAERNSGLITFITRRKGFNNSYTVEEFTKELDDGIDSAKQFAERELGEGDRAKQSTRDTTDKQNLNLKNGQVLVAVAWTTNEGRRKFDMFPEFISGDATEDTNSEERPLYTLLGKDSMNKAFGHTWCFMPSEARWAYSWLFEEAVPTLHPGTARKRVQLILTDACQQETFAIADLVGRKCGFLQSIP